MWPEYWFCLKWWPWAVVSYHALCKWLKNWLKHAILPRERVINLYLLLSADTSMLPSLMRSFINLLVRSSSISWHCRRSLNSGLSRKESLNSSVGRPIDKWMYTATFYDTLTKTCCRSPRWGEVKARKQYFQRDWRNLVRSSNSPFSCLSHFSPPRTSGHYNRASDRKTISSLYNELYTAFLTPLNQK